VAKRAVLEVDSVEEFRGIVSAGQPVLVDYFADWCGPCRALAPVVERIAASHSGNLRVIKVNIDALPELAERARVREVPALHFYRGGQKVAVLNGFRTDEVLRRELARYGLIPGVPAAAGQPSPEPAQETSPGERASWASRLFAKLGGGTTTDSDTHPAAVAAEAGAAAAERRATSVRFIESEEDLNEVIDGSRRQPTALFLHDPWCPISARAFRQMEQLGGELPAIDVSRQRHLNAVVERRTGARHQSPQVIVLRDAVATWEASHGRVTAAAVRAALGEPAPGRPAARPGLEERAR